MTAQTLPAALRACADGLYALEASVELLIAHARWLDRDDFASSFIRTGTSITDGITEMALIDWAAAITALNVGDLPCSSGRAENAPARGQPGRPDPRQPRRSHHRPRRPQHPAPGQGSSPRLRTTAVPANSMII